MEENKNVMIISCDRKLQFVKAIMEVTGKKLLECKNIADQIVPQSNKMAGTLQLNRSSISIEQWLEIAEKCKDFITWRYV